MFSWYTQEEVLIKLWKVILLVGSYVNHEYKKKEFMKGV